MYRIKIVSGESVKSGKNPDCKQTIQVEILPLNDDNEKYNFIVEATVQPTCFVQREH